MSYSIARESFVETYPEIEPLYRSHYEEMRTRLRGQGIEVSPYQPRLDEYVKASNAGYLLTFILRCEGRAVGYCNVYVTNDMHNGDRIAREDALFVTKEHRNGVGKKLVRFGLDELRKLGVKRLMVTAKTDLRVEKIWRRMGFKPVATEMAYQF